MSARRFRFQGEEKRCRLDAVKWVHRLTARIAGALRIGLRGFRRRSTKTLDYLDLEMRKARRSNTADPLQSSLDLDALASTEELRLIIGLHLDGWTWPEIITRLRNR